jgi:PAS domain S-box-containing protein
MITDVIQGMRGDELRLDAVIATTPECIKIVSPDGTLTFMNKAGLSMVEAPTFDAVQGACIYDIIAPEHRQYWQDMHARVCNGETLSWQFDIIGLHGTRRAMETHAVPLPQANGSFAQLAVTRDITQRKAIEKDLRRNEIILRGQKRALELAFSHGEITDILDILTKTVEDQSDGDVVACILLLDDAEKHLLYGSAPNLPHAFNQAAHGLAIGPDVASCGTAAFLKKEISVSDIEHNPLWSNYKDLALSIGLRACWSQPIFSSTAHVLATFSVYYRSPQEPLASDREAVDLLAKTAGIILEWHRDITLRKQAEHALRASEESLKQRVEERTHELHRANYALAQSNESLSKFAHIASHDLKEPTRKIRTFADRLRTEHHLSDVGRDYLERIVTSATRMAALIDGVLGYSTNSGHTPATDAVDLNAVVHTVLEDLELIIEQKKATIHLVKLPTIEGNRFLLHQLFYNLLNNALKFSKPGITPIVSITCDPPSPAGMHRITITDNGIGFEQHDAQVVFDTFVRLHSREKYEGTGLGLALCRKIMQQHGGTIEAHGQPAKGAAFTLFFPVTAP